MLKPRSLNWVVLIIIVSEFILTAAFGFMVPIFALFVVQDIPLGSPEVVGFSLAVYWIIKSVLQLPVARWLDKNHGEIDDFWAMIGGYAVSASLAILFFFTVSKIWHIYLFQALWGVADAFITPPFYAIFARHVDKGQEAFEWSLRSSISVGGGSAAGVALGGVLAGQLGLRVVFLVSGLAALAGAALLFALKPYILPKVKAQPAVPFVEPKKL